MREIGIRGRVLALALTFGAIACGGSDGAAGSGAQAGGAKDPGTSDPGVTEQKSALGRLTPSATADEIATLVANDAAFGFELFRALAGSSNVVFSPHSVSAALAMLYPGTAGTTKSEMRTTLHFAQTDTELLAAFNTLSQELALGGGPAGANGSLPFTLQIANALWGQRGKSFLPSYLDVLAQNFGAGLETVDFAADPERARDDINAWVSDRTAQRIPELLEPGDVDATTELVLTNAIYFDASWLEPFDVRNTRDDTFSALDGTSVSASMMTGYVTSNYAEGSGWKALELPYAGNQAAMLVVLPDPGTFSSFRGALTTSVLASIDEALQVSDVSVSLPRFAFHTAAPLRAALQALGMNAAFSPTEADLSGVDGNRDLYVSDVIHQAYISVGEAGTEAAAATAVTVRGMSLPDPSTLKDFEARTPFLFAIRDIQTKAVLFWGEVDNPRQ